MRRAVQGYRVLRLGVELTRARVALESAGIQLLLDLSPFDLDADAEAVAGLALREASTNGVRHARATRCWVRFGHEPGTFSLEVSDDGIGLRGAPESSGLRGMRERVAALGGRVELSERPRGGTWLRLTLPRPGSSGRPPRGDATGLDASWLAASGRPGVG